jgi:hypothetical protein
MRAEDPYLREGLGGRLPAVISFATPGYGRIIGQTHPDR